MNKINRRDFLTALGALSLPAWFPRLTFSSTAAMSAAGSDILVCIFLRGGADAMNMVIPYGESLYYDNRPTLAISEPGKKATSAIEIDGFFGFHPIMAPLKELFDEGVFAPVIATGSNDDTHSHFDAMEYMESGVPGDKSVRTGWIGRHLNTKKTSNKSPFRAVSIGDLLPSSLRGPVPATALSSIADFHLQAFEVDAQRFQNTLKSFYGGDGWLDIEALQTLDAVNKLAAVNPDDFEPEHGAHYPEESYFSMAMQEISKAIKADIGLEVACTDLGDWDTHEGQGAAKGWMSDNLKDLADTLYAFYTDMGDRMKNITIVMMSEFGRRIDENASAGTDHGHGGSMFLLGGGINGGQIYGEWPGMKDDQLYGPGDLAITTDFRTVLAELVKKRLRNKKIAKVFPRFATEPFLDICKG